MPMTSEWENFFYFIHKTFRPFRENPKKNPKNPKLKLQTINFDPVKGRPEFNWL